jgi:carbon storage regulator
MLILSRKLNESIVIDGRIIVKILRIERDTVKIGIQAPAELPVHRQEVFDMIQKNKQASLNAGTETVPKSPALPVPALRYFRSANSSRRRAASSMREADLLRCADSLRPSHSVSRRT